jgi:hypothetical protein
VCKKLMKWATGVIAIKLFFCATDKDDKQADVGE